MIQLRNPRVIEPRAQRVYDRAEIRLVQLHQGDGGSGSLRVEMQPRTSSGELHHEMIELVLENLAEARSKVPQLDRALKAFEGALEQVQLWKETQQ